MSKSNKWRGGGVVVLFAIVLVLVFRPRSPSHQGLTVEEWFTQYDELWNASYYDAIRGLPRRSIQAQAFEPGQEAFRAMGTNAVSFLAGRILLDPTYSPVELWRIKKRRQLPNWLRFALPTARSRGSEASTAANLLSGVIKPPGEMLVPLLEPALRSTNGEQRLTALIAVRGIRSGYELARPYVERALHGSDAQLQRFGADAVRWFGPAQGQWAVDRLLELVGSPNPDVFEGAVHSLNSLGTNSLRVLPQLKKLLADEPDEARRKKLEHSVHYIREFAPPGWKEE
jgi:hypothetical protein